MVFGTKADFHLSLVQICLARFKVDQFAVVLPDCLHTWVYFCATLETSCDCAFAGPGPTWVSPSRGSNAVHVR